MEEAEAAAGGAISSRHCGVNDDGGVNDASWQRGALFFCAGEEGGEESKLLRAGDEDGAKRSSMSTAVGARSTV